MRFRFIGLLGFFFGFVATVQAQYSVQLRTEANPREIYIGDIIHYRITVAVSSDVTVSPLAVKKEDLNEFEILNYETTPTANARDNKVVVAYNLDLTTFSTGTLTIPALTLAFVTPDGKAAEAKTEPISIKVLSLLEEKGDLGNIRPFKGLFNFRSYLWLWLALGAAVSCGLTFLLYRWLQKRKQKVIALKPARPAEEVAFEALRHLEASDLVAQGNIKEFYYQLSLVLRRYLEDRYSISALERTTSELLQEFRRLKFSLEAGNISRDFLDNADLVKFAKFTPTPDEIAADLERVKQFIIVTTPSTAQPVEEAIAV